jgi:hypothetical protein
MFPLKKSHAYGLSLYRSFTNKVSGSRAAFRGARVTFQNVSFQLSQTLLFFRVRCGDCLGLGEEMSMVVEISR